MRPPPMALRRRPDPRTSFRARTISYSSAATSPPPAAGDADAGIDAASLRRKLSRLLSSGKLDAQLCSSTLAGLSQRILERALLHLRPLLCPKPALRFFSFAADQCGWYSTPRIAFLHTDAARIVAAGGGGSQAPEWAATNQLYQRHPRLLSLHRCTSLRQLKPILAFTLVSALFRNPFVSSRLLLSAASFDLSFASLIFSRMESPNTFSWNTVIRSFAASEVQPSWAALSLYAKMLRRSTLPDKYTFPFLLKACRTLDDLDLGRQVHCHVFLLGFDGDPFVQTALATMYLLGEHPNDARCVFDEITQRDIVLWSAMVSGLVNLDCHEEALEVFNKMRTFDSNLTPNAATMVSTLSACAGVGCLAHAKSLHAYIEKIGLEDYLFVRNSLVFTYAKCGSISCSKQVFDEMTFKDLHSWTAMITALASNGSAKEALELFSKMLESGLLPDSTTYTAVLSACSHAGMIDEGIKMFNSMERVHRVVPELKHYGCMVDLMSRAGLLSQAYDFVLRMPMEPNLAILGALLSGCRVKNDIKLGELVVKKIKSLCHYKGGANVLLSNIYADTEQWKEVVAIRDHARKITSKPAARSWIIVNGAFHEFHAGDHSHPLLEEIHSTLEGLGKLMEV